MTNQIFDVKPQPQTQEERQQYTPFSNPTNSSNRNSKKPYSKQFASSFRVKKEDMPFAIAGSVASAYLAFTDPALLAVILVSFAIAGSLYFISACLPLVSKKLNYRISIWHVLTVVCALTLSFAGWQPSHALFLSGLEGAIVTLVNAGGVGSISPTQIMTLFTFIRIALILVALGGAFAAWQQMQQGQSMTPIMMFVGGIFGIVLAVDILTAVVATGA